MTPAQVAKHRKEYEQFVADEGRAPAESEWRIWMESRARLTIELPCDRHLSASDDPWSVRDWCKDAIEAAGVRWK